MPQGGYDGAKAYTLNNLVSLYGMTFIADGDVPAGAAPAQLNLDGTVSLINLDKWSLFAGDVSAYNMKQYFDQTVAAIAAMIANKANIDGYYQTLTVGFAENLIDTKGQGSVQEIGPVRTSCGTDSISDDGSAIIQEVRGKSIVWNNIANYNIDYTAYAFNGTSFVVKTAAPAAWNSNNYRIAQLKANHKYFIAIRAAITLELYDYNLGAPKFFSTSNGARLYSPTSDRSINLGFEEGTELGTYSARIVCIDLTLMGIASQISTASDFLRLFPMAPYAPYNAGVIKSFAADYYDTVGFNLLDPATGKAMLPGSTGTADLDAGTQCYQISGNYTGITDADGNAITPNASGYFNVTAPTEITVAGYDATTCVHLTWAGYRNGETEEYWKRQMAFGLNDAKVNGEAAWPGGVLRSAFAVFDKSTNSGGVRRLAQVDMGNLLWYRSSAGVFYAEIPTMKYISSSGSGVSTVICSKYSTSSGIFNAIPDKCITNNCRSFTQNASVIVKDDSYDDAATFKAAVTGEKLVYELATPVAFTYDEPLNWVTKIADFGTEGISPSVDEQGNPSTAPLVAVIKYNDDFTRKIVNLSKNYDTTGGIDALCAALSSALSSALNGTFSIQRGAYDEATGAYAWDVEFTPNA